jgi:hypothetical protein
MVTKGKALTLRLQGSQVEKIVMLSATMHLGPVNEILRFAQDDKCRG